MKNYNSNIREYLTSKGIQYRESGDELITTCLFNDCDRDSRPGEAHLYISSTDGRYDCKKCGAQGNLITLQKHFGDWEQKTYKKPRNLKFDPSQVEACHQVLPKHIRAYLHGRGIADEVINAYKLGYGQFYGKWWITIPIKDQAGEYVFFKLRQDPATGNDKITYPSGDAQLYDWEMFAEGSETEQLIVCEGELDRLALLSKGIKAVTGTHGAGTFKEEWLQYGGKWWKTYICFDNDEAGRKGAERVAKIMENHGTPDVHIISLPQEVGEGGDITDYFIKLNGSTEDLFGKYAKPHPEPIDSSKFATMSSSELASVLGLTIKHDEENKLATFLCELSAYTESAQFNISYNAPSSTGKSYIPTEIARLFPSEDVVEIGYCSPKAFFHETGTYDKEKRQRLVDLSHKILIFLDQPHNELLARLRPLLSHDEKEIIIKITDNTQKHGNQTKTILLRGYPSVIFCTAGLRIDEQESTRFLLLSPEVNQGKIREGINATIRKESDSEAYQQWLKENPERALLKERIRAIRQERIQKINITGKERIAERFLKGRRMLKPRHQRDIKRLLALVKSFALLNLWWRDRRGSTIVANEEDIEAAFKLWEKISESQELNLPPYIFNLYTEVILALWRNKNEGRNPDIAARTGQLGISRQEIYQKHFDVYGRMIDTNQFRLQILPMLETAGLVTQEPDPDDKRKMLIFAITGIVEDGGNSEAHQGVQSGNAEDDRPATIQDALDIFGGEIIN